MDAVKARRIAWLMLSVLAVVTILFVTHQPPLLEVSRDDSGALQMNTGDEWTKIASWEKDGIYYFFMPAYVNCEKIVCMEGNMWIDGELVPKGGSNIRWDESVSIKLDGGELFPEWQGIICLMKSENIPTLHISMDESVLEQINQDKAVKQSADIAIIEANGSVNYSGSLEYITGRGNSTWRLDKKPYTLNLNESFPLLDMNSGQKWVLLANAYEGSKIMYKMTMDIAKEIGMDYVPQMEWVDLYINGNYQGNYLLAEKLSVDDGRVEIDDMNKPNELARNGEIPETFVDNYFKGYETDKNPENITGGYLIEKDFLPYYSEETCGFFTERLYSFTIKHPSMATRAEAEYITGFVNAIDSMMAAKDMTVLEYIDEKSFYQKFLIDEIALNSDSNVTSSYFYKKKDENILYAGPVWDYDGVFGESGGIWMNCEQSVLDINTLRGSENLALDWNNVLYSFDSCRQEIIEEYKRILPLYQYYLEEGIDKYGDTIYNSIQMDMVRWDYGANLAGHYQSYDNTLRYLKYFLYQRLTWLNERWDVSCDLSEPPTTKELHDVSVQIGENFYQLQVADGQCVAIEQLPELLDGFEYRYEYDMEIFSPYLPVYEDQCIVAVQK